MESVSDVVYLVMEQKKDATPTSVEKVLGLKERILDMSYYRSPLPPFP
jgi:hypothetical protein